ncbi:MAG: hypothetical protein ACFFAT_14200 [Promethearchaeota archaeon]
MKIRLGSMIFFGTMKFLFYIVLPLIIINILQTIGIMEFNAAYVWGIIIIGIIGTGITVLNHTFKKDTVASGYASIIDSLYSAIFIFYIFGGFTVGDGFGNFSIRVPFSTYSIFIQIGIQIIAYLSLIGAGIKIFQHIFRTAELKKNQELHVKIKKKFRASKFFRVLGTLVNLILLVYIVSIPLSALNVSINLEGGGLSFDWDPGPDPLNISDGDTLSMSLKFNVHNYGVYSILDVRLDINLYVKDCFNGTEYLIPDNTRIGGSPDREYNFYRFTSTISENFTMSIEPIYVPDLVTCDATLLIDISLHARYAQLTADLDVIFQQSWENVTYVP